MSFIIKEHILNTKRAERPAKMRTAARFLGGLALYMVALKLIPVVVDALAPAETQNTEFPTPGLAAAQVSANSPASSGQIPNA